MTAVKDSVAASTTVPPQDPAAAATAARRRAGLVAAVAGLVLLPWFWSVQAVASLGASPPLGGPDQEFVDFYADNYSRLPVNATLFIGQWVILLVFLVALIRAASWRLDLAALLAITLAGASTAIYVGAEGVRLWPVFQGDMTAAKLRDQLDPVLAQAALVSRDGLHAPASVLMGASVLVIAWLLARSGLWAHWVMSGLAALAGAYALSSVVGGQEGWGPGFIILWGPVTAVLLLIGRRHGRSPGLSRAKESASSSYQP